MEEKLLETFVSAFIDKFIDEGKTIFKGLYDEGKQFSNFGLREYLHKQKNNYSYIKTLLRGNSPVFLYDIYFQLDLIKGDEYIHRLHNRQFLYDNSLVLKTDNVKNVFSKSKYVIIIGDAGSGKSTLVKHLFLNCISHSYGIPILVELRYLNTNTQTIEEYINKKIFENELTQNNIILERLLEKGKFIFFLDGYDELNAEVKPIIIENLNSFINKYSKNKYILTSRPYSIPGGKWFAKSYTPIT